MFNKNNYRDTLESIRLRYRVASSVTNNVVQHVVLWYDIRCQPCNPLLPCNLKKHNINEWCSIVDLCNYDFLIAVLANALYSVIIALGALGVGLSVFIVFKKQIYSYPYQHYIPINKTFEYLGKYAHLHLIHTGPPPIQAPGLYHGWPSEDETVRYPARNWHYNEVNRRFCIRYNHFVNNSHIDKNYIIAWYTIRIIRMHLPLRLRSRLRPDT